MAGERVLVIDDSPTITKVVQLVLTKAGYQVQTAADGEQGLQSVRDQRPHLILLDFVMPRMNGYQFCRELTADATVLDAAPADGTARTPVEIADTVLGALDRAGRDTRWCLFVDDLHWADRLTLEVLVLVCDRLRDRRVLVIGAFRPVTTVPEAPLHGMIGNLTRVHGSERIERSSVGSSGQKRRKKTQHQQHLPKVGTTAEHQHLEREAIADTLGIGGMSEGTKKAIGIGIALFFIFDPRPLDHQHVLLIVACPRAR